jgi:hypothetical protein
VLAGAVLVAGGGGKWQWRGQVGWMQPKVKDDNRGPPISQAWREGEGGLRWGLFSAVMA